MNWYTSDWHLGHRNILKFCDRPYDDVLHMNEMLIKNYNEVVKPTDTGIFVGDMAMNLAAASVKQYVDRLNGVKILVLGNHDRGPAAMMNMGFDMVMHEYKIHRYNVNILVKHYPFLQQPEPDYEVKHRHHRPIDDGSTWLIHGHTHSKEKQQGRMLHVGVDAHNFYPVPETWIESRIMRGVFHGSKD